MTLFIGVVVGVVALVCGSDGFVGRPWRHDAGDEPTKEATTTINLSVCIGRRGWLVCLACSRTTQGKA